GLTGAVTLSAGSNVTFSGSGNTLVINASGGSGGSLTAPLTLTNGGMSATLAAPSFAVRGAATLGSQPFVAGELASLDTEFDFGVLGVTVSVDQGTSGVHGSEGGGSATEPVFPSGVWGDSANGVGVYGSSSHASDSGNISNSGVYGTGAIGVAGNSVLAAGSPTTFSIGVEGLATTAGDERIGVYGSALGSAASAAARFDGNIEINGTVHTSAAVVRFDDPLDPENKYISHSVVESPDRMNIYNGMVRLDSKGEATVAMPEWFEAVNEEFRYQLTAVGGPGRDLYVADEVQNNQFRIAGGTPGLKVSWQVTGIRHDAYAARNPVSVEAEKPESERGLYLSPEAFGQPIEKGLMFKTLSAILPERELKKIREQSEKAAEK
ncbi:MAG: hypothetical protein ACRD16_01050, partial [Thermoanaerobaculia bacterium]